MKRQKDRFYPILAEYPMKGPQSSQAQNYPLSSSHHINTPSHTPTPTPAPTPRGPHTPVHAPPHTPHPGLHSLPHSLPRTPTLVTPSHTTALPTVWPRRLALILGLSIVVSVATYRPFQQFIDQRVGLKKGFSWPATFYPSCFRPQLSISK